jgi:hypothetical protein
MGLDSNSAAEPRASATVVVGIFGSSCGALSLPDPEEADEGRDKPQESWEEAESDDSLGLSALVSMHWVNVVPVKDTTARGADKLLDAVSACYHPRIL